MADFKRATVDFADTANFDAFSRLRVSQSHSLFDSQFTYDLQPLLWEPITAGSGAAITHDATNRCALLTFASTPTGGKAIMQTFEHFRYTAGKGQLVLGTFNFNGGVADCLKFAGYCDGSNGIEYRLNGTAKELAILSDTTAGDEVVAQADWNLDKLDGTGASKITLAADKTQILVIDLQALYVGRVRVGFDIGGIIVHAHEFNHANLIAYPYTQTANLPFRVGMTCTGTVSTTMLAICTTVAQEGGETGVEGFHFSVRGSATAANGARTHLLSIQPALTFNSIVNRSKFILESMDIVVTGNNPVLWEVCLGDVLTGTTAFGAANATYSAVDFNTAGTTSGAPAIVIDQGYVPATAQQKGALTTTIPFRYPICLDAAGAARVMARLTLLVTGLGGTSACQGSFNWKEIR